MELRHEFTVPASPEETWAAFNDIESVALCFPGAAVTSVEGDTFQGNCKVKLGPIALVYTGTGTFTEKDESAGRMVIDAKGKDKRGNGTAGAHVVATMTGREASQGTATHVEVLTDLNITGKPAQFGRGVMQDVSDKLLGQFVACLEQKLGAPPEPEPGTRGGSCGRRRRGGPRARPGRGDPAGHRGRRCRHVAGEGRAGVGAAVLGGHPTATGHRWRQRRRARSRCDRAARPGQGLLEAGSGGRRRARRAPRAPGPTTRLSTAARWLGAIPGTVGGPSAASPGYWHR